ncbi:hypothetical protein M3Y99_01724500 [Aphelenchoides fujianensis]|nr:hypothetical protein M3Y99_01724500 [Aphelenchoides fujianensis]
MQPTPKSFKKRRLLPPLPFESAESPLPPVSTNVAANLGFTALALASEQQYNQHFLNTLNMTARPDLPLNFGDLSADFFPPALLEAMAARPKDPDQIARADIDVIAKNLSCVADATFYLKTTSEIVKKWPTAKVRVFLQDLLKKAMEEDNKICFASD